MVRRVSSRRCAAPGPALCSRGRSAHRHDHHLLRSPPPSPRDRRADRRRDAALLREAAARGHDPGARSRGRVGRHVRSRPGGPRRGAAGARPPLRGLPVETAWEEWTAQGRTHDALPLVWPVPAVRHDRIPHHIDGKLGYFSMDAGVPITAGTWEAVTAGAAVALDRGGRHRRRRCRRLRPVPAARAPRRRGDDGRLLLPEQRRHRRAVPPRPRLCPRGGARRGLPPRQRHPEHLLRAARRAVRVAPRRPVGRVSLLPRLRRRGGRRAPARATPSTTRCPKARRGAPTAWRWPTPATRSSPSVPTRSSCRSASTPTSTIRSPASGSPSRTIRGSARGSRRIGRPTLFVMEGGYAVDDIGVNAVNVLSGFESV